MTEIRSTGIVGLGGNLKFKGSATSSTLVRAISRLAAGDVTIRAVSRFFQTPCFPAGAGPDYVNAAVLVETTLDPQSLLDRLNGIEAEFERDRQQRWGMRTLDMDILAFGQTILPDSEVQEYWRNLSPEVQVSATPTQLILPHPRLQDRAFALVPMVDIAPDWVHPVLNKTARQLCAELPDAEIQAVRAI